MLIIFVYPKNLLSLFDLYYQPFFFDGNTEVKDKAVLRSFTLYVGTPNAFKNKLREGSKSYVY